MALPTARLRMRIAATAKKEEEEEEGDDLEFVHVPQRDQGDDLEFVHAREDQRFSTGLGVSDGSALMHDFYSREVTNAVHPTVDAGLAIGEVSVKAYVSINLSLGDWQLAAQFYEIPLDLRMIEAEQVGFDILKKTMVDKLPNDLEGMESFNGAAACSN